MAGIWSVSLWRDILFTFAVDGDGKIHWLVGICPCPGSNCVALVAMMHCWLVKSLSATFVGLLDYFARAGDLDIFNIGRDVGVKGGARGDIAGDKGGDLSRFEVDNDIVVLITVISLAKDGPARTAKGQ